MTPKPAGPVRIAKVRLDDDGIVDLIAVDLAAKGVRPVELTETEQTAAALVMLKSGAPLALVSYRLRLSAATVRRIADAVRLESAVHDAPAPTLPAVA